MRKRTTRMAAVGAAAGLLALGLTATSPAQAGTVKKWGCPAGEVCVYTTAGWINDTPSYHWGAYGYHPIYNEYGTRVIFNNQYATSSGRAGAYACRSQSASSCGSVIAMDDWEYVDITPINYVRLTASGG